MRFTVVYAPRIESLTISQGLASEPNMNYLVVGRREARALTMHGT